MSELNLNNNNFAGYYNVKHNAKMINESIENGTAPFLPNEQGIITPKPIYNANTGYLVANKDLIPLQIMQAQNGYQSNFVGNMSFAKQAETRTKENQKPYFYPFFDKSNNAHRTGTLFFSDQVENVQAFENLAKQNLKEKTNQAGQIPVIEINNKDEYLAKYIASCKTGVALKVSPEIANEFKADMTNYCNQYLSQKVKLNEREQESFMSFNKLFSNYEEINKFQGEFKKVLKENAQSNKPQQERKQQAMER